MWARPDHRDRVDIYLLLWIVNNRKGGHSALGDKPGFLEFTTPVMMTTSKSYPKSVDRPLILSAALETGYPIDVQSMDPSTPAAASRVPNTPARLLPAKNHRRSETRARKRSMSPLHPDVVEDRPKSHSDHEGLGNNEAPPKMSWETLEIVDVDPTGTLDRWKREGNQK